MYRAVYKLTARFVSGADKRRVNHVENNILIK